MTRHTLRVPLRSANKKTPVAFATGAIVTVRDVGGFTR